MMKRIFALLFCFAFYSGEVHAFTPEFFGVVATSGATPSFFAPLKTTLVPTISTAAPTFTRASAATITDFSGQLWQANSGEARFTGARRVHNLLTFTENFSNASWTTLAGGTGTLPTKTDNYGVAPDGTTTAARLQATIGSGTSISDYSLLRQYFSQNSSVNSVWLKSNTGSTQNVLLNYNNGIVMPVTTSWQRFSYPLSSITFDVGALGGYSTNTLDILIWHPQVEVVPAGQSNQNPSEYVSVGVLSAPYQGANVDGVQYFNYLNGNTVASNVVTAGTGALITNSNSSYANKNGPFGFYSEQASTNLALYSRDMTQTNWVKVNTTAALTQTGIDGAPNSASLITATLANGTVLQTITQAATSATYSVYVKRITGTGTITMQQGATTQTITPTSSWTRYSLPASVLNPVIGFTLATSGDAIAVDGNQLENLAFPTSWVPTTTTSVSRSRDTLTYPLSGIANNTQGSVYAEASFPITIPTSTTVGYGNNYIWDFGANMLNGILYNGTFYLGISGTTSTVTWSTVSANTVYKTASNWTGGNTFTAFLGGSSGAAQGGTVTLSSNLTVGSYGGAGYVMNGNVRNVKIYKKALPTATLQSMTTP